MLSSQVEPLRFCFCCFEFYWCPPSFEYDIAVHIYSLVIIQKAFDWLCFACRLASL
uniref:Uncharacterized protein n=1 Tax=Lotus japonicus TaxID=34305 RepID=I3SCS2_LOTJA|nr:unknown [Lotus japonicus]